MARLCERTPLPIALDEELIGLFDTDTRTEMLDTIRPKFLVLKPSLIGGMVASDHWIYQAEERGIGWWITSALESNVGLNAIAQYTFTKKNPMQQGLGTGSLYTNNLAAPLQVEGGFLHYRPGEEWNFDPIDKLWNNPQKTT
jgi:O-succinylbenzoate synthase